MSDSRSQPAQQQESDENRPKGPNLILIYALLVFGMLVAGAIAAMIVWPFYIRR